MLNGTLTGAAWAALTNSGTRYDVTASAISGGTVISTFDAIVSGSGAGAKGNVTQILSRAILAATPTATADILSVVATSYSGTSNLSGKLGWKEPR